LPVEDPEPGVAVERTEATDVIPVTWQPEASGDPSQALSRTGRPGSPFWRDLWPGQWLDDRLRRLL